MNYYKLNMTVIPTFKIFFVTFSYPQTKVMTFLLPITKLALCHDFCFFLLLMTFSPISCHPSLDDCILSYLSNVIIQVTASSDWWQVSMKCFQENIKKKNETFMFLSSLILTCPHCHLEQFSFCFCFHLFFSLESTVFLKPT